jgi:glycosyltransferase involved in cell wall biosynthesis
MKIKVLYIIETLGVGGAENLLLNTVRFLDKDNFEPIVLYLFNDDDLVKDFNEIGVSLIGPIFNIYSRTRINSIFEFFFGINSVRKAVKRVKPDIVHTNLFFANVYGRIGSWLGGVHEVITTLHVVDYTDDINNSFRLIVRKFLDFFTGRLLVKVFIVGNEAIKENMVLYTGSKNVELIYNGIDVDQISSIKHNHSTSNTRKELGIKPEESVLLNIGRLDHQKGQHFLIKAMPNIIKKNNTKLLIVGSGPLESDLMLLARKMGVSNNVIFLEKRKDIFSIIKLSDIFVFPSLFEGLAISLLEAMALSKPVVLFDYKGAREVITDQSEGLVILKRDVRALEYGILKLLDSPKLKKDMGDAAFKKVNRVFNIKENNKNLERVYFDTVKSNLGTR